jgi:hypothetical protein
VQFKGHFLKRQAMPVHVPHTQRTFRISMLCHLSISFCVIDSVFCTSSVVFVV